MDPNKKLDLNNNSDMGYGYDFYDSEAANELLTSEIIEIKIDDEESDEKENHPFG